MQDRDTEQLLHGTYRIIRVIGEGGFGTTYEGIQEGLGRRVAIKKLRSQEEKARKDFFIEARNIVDLSYNNPAMVKVTDYFEVNDTAYMVMDYLDGQELSKILSERTLPASDAFRRMLPIMEALKKIHEKKVIHRDISPDNIMVMQDGSFVLMDFGASRSHEEKNHFSCIVKDGYAPAEQYSSASAQGPWTDIYALCATLYHAITGIQPEKSVSRLLDREHEMPMPSALGIEIEPELEAVLKKGLEIECEDRYQKLDEMLSALREVPGMMEQQVLVQKATKTAKEKAKTKKKGALKKCLLLSAAAMIILLSAGILINTVISRVLKKDFYDSEKMYRFLLVPDEEITAKGYKKAVETLRNRMDLLCDGEEYRFTQESEDDIWELIIPKSVFCNKKIQYVMQAYLTRPIRLSIVYRDEANLKHVLELAPEDIVSIDPVDGQLEDFDVQKIGIESDTYRYYTMRFSEEFLEDNREILQNSQTVFYVAQDAMGGDDYYHYYGKWEEDHSAFYVVNNDLEDTFQNLLYYNMTHEPLEKEFSYIHMEETSWIDPEKEERIGENQVSEKQLKKMENDLIFVQYSVPVLTRGETMDFYEEMGRRLDLLEVPYSISTIHNNKISVEIPTKHMGVSVMELLIKNGGIYMTTGSVRRYLSMYGLDFSVMEGENPVFVIESAVWNKDKLVSVMDTMGDGQIYLSYTDLLPFISTSQYEVTEEGKIRFYFDTKCWDEQGKLKEEDIWLLRLLEEIFTSTKMPSGLFLEFYGSAEYLGKEPEFTFTYYNEQEKIRKAVQTVYKDAKVSFPKKESETVSIHLFLDVNEKLPENGLTLARKLGENDIWLNSMFRELDIYLVDEKNTEGERTRIFFRKKDEAMQDNPEKQSEAENNLICFGIFRNGRLKSYSEQFQTILKENSFYRNICMDDWSRWSF